MKKKIQSFIKEILIDNGREIDFDITEKTNLRDLGMSSYDLASLTVLIEDEFDVDIFENGLVNTVGEIYQILESKKD